MREILFRGKCGKIWHYGDAHTDYKGKVSTIIVPSACWNRQNVETQCAGYFGISVETLGQYIGLTDRYGKKIFEGDIGRYKQTDGASKDGIPILCIGEVFYNKKTASYAVRGRDEIGGKCFDYFPIKDFEIIGNIHESPSLLEVFK